MKGRTYDVELVTREGGIIKVVNVTDFRTGIIYFLQNLDKRGFLVNALTFYASVVINSENNTFTTEEKEKLKHGVILSEKTLKGEYSYGMLVRSESVYRYLIKFVENNRLHMDSCRRNHINYQLSLHHTLESLDLSYSIFSPEGGMFVPTLKYCCGLLALVVMFGIGYEIWRKGKRQNSVT